MAPLDGIEAALRARARAAGDAAAQATARQISAGAPRDTGRLAASPTVTRREEGNVFRWTVAVDVKSASGFPYDVAQEEGTGIYIGRGRIYPRRAPRLVFFWKKIGRKVAFRSVRGTPPTRFFAKGIRGWPDRLREAFTAAR